MVAPPGPGVSVARVQECVDFGFAEERHQVAVEAFGPDGEHPLDRGRVFRVAQGRVGEERVDGSQPVVAGPHAVVPGRFNMGQRSGDERCVEFAEIESAGWLV